MIRLAWDGKQTVSDHASYRGLTLSQLSTELKKPVEGFLVPAGAADAGLAWILLEEDQAVFVVPPVVSQASAEERLVGIKQPAFINQQFLLRGIDKISYCLAVAKHKGDMLPAPLAELHPAWDFLAFTSVNLAFARELIAVIGDWRWYWNERKPGSHSKLFAYLGLFPNIVKSVVADLNKFPSRPIEQRCHTLVKMWYDGYRVTDNAKLCKCFHSKTRTTHADTVLYCCRFLLRGLLAYWESKRSVTHKMTFSPWRVFTDLGVHQFSAYVTRRNLG